MSILERALHPVDFVSDLLHFSSRGAATARDSSPASAVGYSATRDPATNNIRTGMTPVELDRDDDTVHEPPFVQQMVMDLL